MSKRKKMSYERRRRRDRCRKRIYRDSLPTESSSPINGHNNYVSKAYAVNDFNFEDLDRMVMFITESKQIQGRYYVRYLPGMLNSAGELTPCNYRPVFSFSSSTAATSPNYCSSTSLTSYQNGNNHYYSSHSSTPEVVDLTDSEEVSLKNNDRASSSLCSPPFLNESPKTKTHEKQHIEPESKEDDGSKNHINEGKELKIEKSEEKNASIYDMFKKSSSVTSTITNRKQTARKSMRQRTEILPCVVTENNLSPTETESQLRYLEKETSVLSSSTMTTDSNNTCWSKSTSNSNKTNHASLTTSNCKSKISGKWDLLDGITVTMNPDFR